MPNPLLTQKGKAVFLTILAGVLWGTSFPIIKIGLSTIDPFAFVFLSSNFISRPKLAIQPLRSQTLLRFWLVGLNLCCSLSYLDIDMQTETGHTQNRKTIKQ